ncbi:proton-conducting transporter membrane subunit [Marinospirillum sp.]|uniref:proton-conducting transporter transmembrane domain-containing protein n=1 Tax=Marinospirillum sp. TaxID=2183934 RepID=UPI003A835528
MMASFLLLTTPLWPFTLACFYLLMMAMGRRWAALNWLWVSAPLPALALALLMPADPAETALHLPFLLLGSLWWLDELRQVFLVMTALLWLMAGLYARGYFATATHSTQPDQPASNKMGFATLWLLTLSGNLLLIIAEDIASFYLGFALMTFAAYGLVIDSRKASALYAGRVYLTMALLGEATMLAALIGLSQQAAAPQMSAAAASLMTSEPSIWILSCLLLGFGVKAGLPLLHLWLPLAHPVAPTPASAVLSGAMIKAGLLGWCLLLPLGQVSWPVWGQIFLVAGLISMLGAVLPGLLQSHPKAVLAYSSISQMGMMVAVLGASLIDPALWPLVLPALLFFVAHHGLNKGALFLAVGLAEKPPRWPLALLLLLTLLPPLALTGLLTSGLVTKWMLKQGLYAHDWSQLVIWLTLGAGGTTLLMLRYLTRLWALMPAQPHAETPPISQQLAWLGLMLSALALPWWLPATHSMALLWPDFSGWLELAWLPLVMLLLTLAWIKIKPISLPNWPPGDLLLPLSWLARRLWQSLAPWREAELNLAQRTLDWIKQRQPQDQRADRLVTLEALIRQKMALLFLCGCALLASLYFLVT